MNLEKIFNVASTTFLGLAIAGGFYAGSLLHDISTTIPRPVARVMVIDSELRSSALNDLTLGEIDNNIDNLKTERMAHRDSLTAERDSIVDPKGNYGEIFSEFKESMDRGLKIAYGGFGIMTGSLLCSVGSLVGGTYAMRRNRNSPKME